ncbi:hypothetical protein AB1Y20_006814 [Prymnesium parvum]|uniref:Transporter n=1 Tax=Prymnesium parvum TaxID=97485 RepID=A0AB34J0X7_PRYPA
MASAPPLSPPADGQSSLLIHAIEVAFYTNSQVLIYVAVGAYSVYSGVVDGGALRKLAGLVLNALFPALTFSMFVAYTAERVADWSPILVVALLHIYGGGLMGKLGAKLFRLRSPHEQLCILSVAFGNVASLPFVMIGPIVNNWRGAVEYRGQTITPSEAVQYAGGMIALYSGMWVINFFSVGKWYVSTIPELGEAAEDPQPREAAAPEGAAPPPLPLWKRLYKLTTSLVLEPTVFGTLLALLVGCVPALKDTACGTHENCDNGALRFIATSTKGLGDTGVTLSTIVLGAALMLSYKAARAKVAAARTAATEMAVTSERGAPSNELVESAETEERTMLHRRGARWWHLSEKQRAYIVIISIKLILLPAVAFPISYAAVEAGLIPKDDGLLQIIIYMQAAVPSSQTAVSFLAASGKPNLSQELSGLYLPQYVLSVFTIAFSIVSAISLIGES